MSTFLVRSFVLVLALSGFGATTSVSTTGTSSAVSADIVASPTPLCPPNSGQTCGMD